MKLLKLKLKILELLIKILGLQIEILKLKEKKPAKRKETIEEMIRRIAKEEMVNEDLMVRIALCESQLDPKAVNVNKNGTRDRGLFQINDFWWLDITDEQAFDPEWSTRWACKQVKAERLHLWKSSRHCWEC